MTILITGGAGYIGSQMAYALADAGERFVVLDNLSTGAAACLPAATTLIVGDCGDSDLLAATIRDHRIAAIMHFAGSIVVPESMQHPLRYYFNNTANTLATIEAVVNGKVPHFIFSSTAAVYGHPAGIPVTEDAPAQPISPYGRTKLISEHMLADAALAHGLKFVALRYFNVAGADPRMRSGQSTPTATHLVKIAVQTALGSRSKMDVYGTDYPTPDGTCIRDYIHVSDLVQAHVDALRYLRQGGASVTLNCGYGRGASVYEVIQAVKRVSRVDFRVDKAPRRLGDSAALVASSERARALLGWRPKFDDLDTIVKHALAWEKTLTKRKA